jgi:hypothetical protein
MQSKVVYVLLALIVASILNYQNSLSSDDQDFGLFKS